MPTEADYKDHPAQSQEHWYKWVAAQLTDRGIAATVLEMPTPYAPVYEEWKEVFEKQTIGPDTMLIGHSGGAGFIIRWLSENNVQVGQVILVAPWIDPNKELTTGFFDFAIDPTLSDRTDGVTIFISNDDEKPMLDTVEILEQTLKGYFTRRFEDKGYFTIGDMGTHEFPELIERINKK